MASLEKRALLQGRMDAPSGLIHAEMHIHVHFALASHAFRGDAQGAEKTKAVLQSNRFLGSDLSLAIALFPES